MNNDSEGITDLLTAINCPFDFHDNPKYLDGYPCNTISLVDYSDTNGFTTPINSLGASVTISGMLIMYSYGNNNVQQGTYDINTGSIRDEKLYSPIVAFLGAQGEIMYWVGTSLEDKTIQKFNTVRSSELKRGVKNHAVKSSKTLHRNKDIKEIVNDKIATRNLKTTKGESNKLTSLDVESVEEEEEKIEQVKSTAVNSDFWSYDTSNYAQIFGLQNGYSSTTCAVTDMRIVSAGIRIWPTIETVTNSDTVAVSRYYVAQVTPLAISTAATVGTNVFDLLRDCPSYMEFSNAEGASARLQPYQLHNMITPYKMSSITSLGQATLDTNALNFPCIAIRLTYNVEVDNGDFYSFPARTTFRTYIEAVQRQPSPYWSARPGLALNMSNALATFTYDTNTYPPSTKGHSFFKVAKSFVGLMLNNTNEGRLIKSIANNVKGLTNGKFDAERMRNDFTKAKGYVKDNKNRINQYSKMYNNYYPKQRPNNRGKYSKKQESKSNGEDNKNKENIKSSDSANTQPPKLIVQDVNQ